MMTESPDSYYMPDQFNNPDNIRAHFEGTGPEIWEQTEGMVDWFVSGMGTSGTLMGVAAFLREKDPSISILGVEPTLGHNIQGLKNMSESIVPGLFDPVVLDRRVIIQDEAAFKMSKRLASEEGIFCGMSSGAVVQAALDLSREIQSGTIVAILPDRGDRYLTTVLYCNERCRTALCREKHCRKCLGTDLNP